MWLIHHLDPNIEINKTSHFCGFLCSSLFEIFLLKHVCEKKESIYKNFYLISQKGDNPENKKPWGV